MAVGGGVLGRVIRARLAGPPFVRSSTLLVLLFALGCAAPVPSPSPTPTSMPSPAPSGLHAGGMATVIVDNLRLVIDPSDPSAHSDLTNRLQPLTLGAELFLIEGPRRESGVDYWAIDGAGPGGLSWVAATRRSVATIVPYLPPCPPTDGLAASTLSDLGAFEALVCYGSADLTLRGELSCGPAAVDAIVGGAAFMSDRVICMLDDALQVFGSPVTGLLYAADGPGRVNGQYEVRGHFDDPAAQSCHSIPFGWTPLNAPGNPELGPVASCRTMFVATAVAPLAG